MYRLSGGPISVLVWSYFFKGWEEIRCLSYKIDVLVLRLARAVLGERKMSSVVRLVISGVSLGSSYCSLGKRGSFKEVSTFSSLLCLLPVQPVVA